MRLVASVTLFLCLALASQVSRAESADEARIAFLSHRSNQSGMYVSQGDGSNPIHLTYDVRDSSPTWSPDGQKLAFVRFVDGVADIFSINSDGTGLRNLTSSECIELDPAWSPDGQTIAFTRFSNPNVCLDGGIYFMDPDGSNPRVVFLSSSSDADPTWSPDGAQIAFSSRWGQGFQGQEIRVMNADGTDVRNITNSFHNDSAPSWSPDGSRIAFVSQRNFRNQIFTMTPDGSDQIAVTDDPNSLFDDSPAWTGDSSSILFTRFSDIFAVDRDGSNVRPLITSEAADFDAAWFGPGSPPLPTPSPTPTVTVVPSSSPTPTPVPTVTTTRPPTPSQLPTAGSLPITGGVPGQDALPLALQLAILAPLAAVLIACATLYMRRR